MSLFTVYVVVLTAKLGFNNRLSCIPPVSILLRLRRALVTSSAAVKVGLTHQATTNTS